MAGVTLMLKNKLNLKLSHASKKWRAGVPVNFKVPPFWLVQGR